MTGAGTQLDSLRFSSLESSRLAWVFALSLLAHLLAWGGYEAGKELNLWQKLHLPPLMLFTKIKPTPTPVREGVPIEFVDVNPAQPATPAGVPGAMGVGAATTYNSQPEKK